MCAYRIYFFMGKTKNKRPMSKTLRKRKRAKTARKYKGGVSFNAPLGVSPGQYTYPLNMYETQLNRSPLVMDTRLQTGLPYQVGGKMGRKRRRNTRRKKMKGGFSITGDNLLTGSTETSNPVFAFGESGGTKYMMNRITSAKPLIGTYLEPGRVWSNMV